MKCENDEQYEAAMNTLIAGTAGAVRESLMAIHDYLGDRPKFDLTTYTPEERRVRIDQLMRDHIEEMDPNERQQWIAFLQG
jgi:hypothetical protein